MSGRVNECWVSDTGSFEQTQANNSPPPLRSQCAVLFKSMSFRMASSRYWESSLPGYRTPLRYSASSAGSDRNLPGSHNTSVDARGKAPAQESACREEAWAGCYGVCAPQPGGNAVNVAAPAGGIPGHGVHLIVHRGHPGVGRRPEPAGVQRPEAPRRLHLDRTLVEDQAGSCSKMPLRLSSPPVVAGRATRIHWQGGIELRWRCPSWVWGIIEVDARCLRSGAGVLSKLSRWPSKRTDGASSLPSGGPGIRGTRRGLLLRRGETPAVGGWSLDLSVAERRQRETAGGRLMRAQSEGTHGR